MSKQDYSSSTKHIIRSSYIMCLAFQVLEKIINGVQGFGFHCQGWIESPLKGVDGNIEFLARFSRTSPLSAAKADIAKLHRVVQNIESVT